MNTIILAGNNHATQSSRLGWFNAMIDAGHVCYIWDQNSKSAFEVFDSFKPDLIILSSSELDRALTKCLVKNPDIKIALFASNHGEFGELEDKEKYFVEEVVKKCNIENVFSTHLSEWIDITHNKWVTQFGILPVSCLYAADTKRYQKTEYEESITCDISYIGNYNTNKISNLSSCLFALSGSPFSFKTFGYTPSPIAEYLGVLPNSESFCRVVSNSKINLNITRNSTFDFNERVFKIGACGGFCLSTQNESLQKVFEDKVVFFSQENMFDSIHSLLNDKQERLSRAEMLNKFVLSYHTYYHRALMLLKILKINNGIENLYEKIGNSD